MVHLQHLRILNDLTLLQFFTRETADIIANNCNQHCIYFLSADQIGHHLVFETYQGAARVFQSSVKARVTSTSGAEHFVGCARVCLLSVAPCHALCMYSAAEWSATEPIGTWDSILKAAHLRWGGGRELGHLSLLALLDLICRLQTSTDEVADVMFAQAPQEAKLVTRALTHTKIISNAFLRVCGAFLTRLQGLPTSPKTCSDDVDRCANLAACFFDTQRCTFVTVFMQSPLSTTHPGQQLTTERTAL